MAPPLWNALVVLLATAGCALPQTAVREEARDAKETWQTVARYPQKVLAEISGLAVSGRDPAVLWAHNDSGGEAALYAIHLDGRFLGVAKVPGVRNVDWEDIASFRRNGRPFLVIGDTGDNEKRRPFVVLHVLPEPEPDSAEGYFRNVAQKPSLSFRLRYPDGPRDCEAVAVLPGTDRLFLLAKDAEESVAYEVSLDPKLSDAIQTAKKIATLPRTANAIAPRSLIAALKAGVLGARATALDISPDGRTFAVLTYTDLRFYAREADEPWDRTLGRQPSVIALPDIFQPEAFCFSADGRRVFISSEETPTPLVARAVP